MRIKLMTLCMALCCLCLNAFAQNVPDYVPTEGLVAWYPFNGNASDESGNEQDGEIVGAQLTVDRFGLSESAYSFDHTRIEIENSATNDQFKTISFWFMSSSLAGNQVAFKQNIYVGHGYERVSCAIQWNGTHFAGKEVCNAGWEYVNVGGEVNDGIWHHYVGILDSTQKRLYIDGTFLDESEFNPENMCSGGDLIIGQEWDGVPYDFIGDLDDFGFWDRALTEEEIQALYNAPALVPGCTESIACNFNEEANIEDDSCVYPLFGEDCETGGAACGEGTIWDSSLQSCVGFDECPSDLNDDGIVGINDLLSLLSDFGMECPPEMAEWTCGDLMNYHGYDYATVQIGEQCWFAENLRTAHYTTGDALAQFVPDSIWIESIEPIVSYYNESIADCDGLFLDNNECSIPVIEDCGLLYNGFALSSPIGLCPSGWHVAEKPEFDLVLTFLLEHGWDGAIGQGLFSQEVGFNAQKGGYRLHNGDFLHKDEYAYLWTNSVGPGGRWLIKFNETTEEMLWLDYSLPRHGLSVRCLKDTE